MGLDWAGYESRFGLSSSILGIGLGFQTSRRTHHYKNQVAAANTKRHIIALHCIGQIVHVLLDAAPMQRLNMEARRRLEDETSRIQARGYTWLDILFDPLVVITVCLILIMWAFLS
jgi:hypothetical protein